MRLINCQTLELEEFVRDTPRYAVLSHTWGDDEVTFADMQKGEGERMLMDNDDTWQPNAQHRAGYAKIEQTCRLALSQGIMYAWVDTCCIDKSSSSELSEAINSMFAWYRDSAVCYAWLFDFKRDADFNLTDRMVIASFEEHEFMRENGVYDDPRQLTTTELEMRDHNNKLEMRDRVNKLEIRDRVNKVLKTCRWFSRGWALQELIAPKHVEFYDRSWKFFGTKTDLAPILSYVTAIDVAVLKGGSLSNVLIGRRMSWASNRQTTRVEDMAYCLLGLFDITMPLLYGEGEKAFVRLQEELIKSSNDLSIFAWTAPLNDQRQYRSLWASSPKDFTSCKWLVKPALEWNGRGDFSITSRGLRTTDMIRIVRGDSSRAGSYFLPLDCVDARSNKDIRFVSLEQYGPSLFARRKPWLYDYVVDIDVSMASRLSQPQYICCRETHELDNMIMASRVGSVQIALSFEEAFDEESITVDPETDWDLRNSILLSYRRRQFWGWWKIKSAACEENGIVLVCVQLDGWLLYGIFSLDSIPIALDQSDLIPSRVADALQKLPNRTSVYVPPFRHTVQLRDHDLGRGDHQIPCTLLTIESERVDAVGGTTAKARSKLHRLFTKRTWP
ncbi:HET-domain-containing protein [Xylariaceae sp. FL0255]|nr:HET-domain-containing protein [Xylariaceae sp. FL0255]